MVKFKAQVTSAFDGLILKLRGGGEENIFIIFLSYPYSKELRAVYMVRLHHNPAMWVRLRNSNWPKVT